jgi:hypothetical protein
MATDIAAYRSTFSSRPGGQAAISGGMGCCTKPLARQGLPGGVIYKHFAPVLGARQGG